jgi:hypothetical protein
MKHITFLALIFGFALTSCHRKVTDVMAYKQTDSRINPETQAWRGTYKGYMTTPDCPSAGITITLGKEMNYNMTYRCVGSADLGMRRMGKYLVDASRSTLILTTGNGREFGRFNIFGSSLVQIDRQGNRLDRNETMQYVLRK